jgi:hypothetical protein
MFTGIKDSLASSAARSLIASRLGRYGKLTELRIRSQERSIRAEFLLEGEEDPVVIQVDRYRITCKDGENAVVVEAVTASRVWLENLLQDVVVGRVLPVPQVVLLALGKAEEDAGQDS